MRGVMPAHDVHLHRHSGRGRNPASLSPTTSWPDLIRPSRRERQMRGSSPRMTKWGEGNFLLTAFLGVCIWSASAPRRRRSSRSLTSSVDTWSSCRLSQGPRGTLAGTDGGGSAVEPPHLAPQLGGTSPTQLILDINGSGHQSYSLK